MESNVKNEISNHIVDLLYKNKTEKNGKLNILNISFDISHISGAIKKTNKTDRIYNLELVEKPEETIIKTLDVLYDEKYFDYIILDDILEFIIKPSNLLEYIKKYLNSKGEILATMKNFIYCKEINSIISGNFSGLDDDEFQVNRVKNYSLLDCKNLFNKSGYKVNTVLSVKTKEIEEYKDLINLLCKLTNENMREQYSSYNYIVEASLKEKKGIEEYILNS